MRAIKIVHQINFLKSKCWICVLTVITGCLGQTLLSTGFILSTLVIYNINKAICTRSVPLLQKISWGPLFNKVDGDYH